MMLDWGNNSNTDTKSQLRQAMMNSDESEILPIMYKYVQELERNKHEYQQESIDRLKRANKTLEEAKEMKEDALEILDNTPRHLRFDSSYDYKKDDRWTKTIGMFDKLWHYGETGPDGCPKCEDYCDILFNAFNADGLLYLVYLDGETDFLL